MTRDRKKSPAQIALDTRLRLMERAADEIILNNLEVVRLYIVRRINGERADVRPVPGTKPLRLMIDVGR